MMALSIENPHVLDISSEREQGPPVPARSVARSGYAKIDQLPERADLRTPTPAETIRFRGQPQPTLVPGDAPPAPSQPTVPATPETWNQRRAEAVKRLPDFAQVVEADNVPFTPAMAAALAAVPHGPDLAYALAKKPGEVLRIARLDPAAQAVEIGRLANTVRPATPARPAPARPIAHDGELSMEAYATKHAPRVLGERRRVTMFGNVGEKRR